jgi:class 3 adenylate cyclase/DNA-binding SARP family transcriptional activator
VPFPKFRLSLLARFELAGPDGPIDLHHKKLAGLLAYMACTAPVPQPRNKLTALLWGSHFDAQARQNLRQALFRLRRVLGQDALIGDGEEISFASGVVDCDAVRLEALIREGSRTSLRQAIDLYKGRLLTDVAISEETWADWVAGKQQRLEDLALDAFVKFGEIELDAGHANSALETAHRALAINNLREDAHRLIIQTLAAAGRKAEALKHYQDLVELLKRELNTDPDAATKLLVADLGSAKPTSRSPPVGEIAEIPLPLSDRRSSAARSGNLESPAARRAEEWSEAAVRSGSPERRQLTIMACDIVGCLPLSASLDPEEMRDLIAAFYNMVADVVGRFDGFIAQHLGDGVLVYFGYPQAHEHDAEQAVRAGFAILEAVSTLTASSGMPLRARAGIASGLVVVGEQLGTNDTRQHVAIGETPILATRLQTIAAPGEVVIAAGTHRLAGRMFHCRALDAGKVKGLPQPPEAWQVFGEAADVSRFEARRTGALTPLIGRQEEIELLLRRWDEAKLGEGRVVLISGEPGIGKSRLTESLLIRLLGEQHVCLRYFCSPHHTHSPLYPFITQLERAAGFERNSDSRTKLDRLEALLKPGAKDVLGDVALIAELLGVALSGCYPALAVSSEQKREMTLTALVCQIDGMAAQSPVLIVFEDAHWMDPTSQDLLDRMVARAANLPVLLVVTARPELHPTWVGEPHVTMLALSRLGRRDSADIIGGVTRDKALPDVVVEQVLAHADGVPLFIEELTSTLLESGLLREAMDRYELDGPLPPFAIPATLQASLAARLDRLASVKNVAQIGAAIGREFSHELIGAVASLAPRDLDAALERLTASGLITRRGTPPAANYSFKHALVQDAAYATMLKSQRRQLHASIAKVLVERFPAIGEGLPELVAHHFTEAGYAIEAIRYWRRAGRLAYARSANREAVSSFERVLRLLKSQPESPAMLEEAFETRLELRLALNQLGEARQMLEQLLAAERLAERLNDDRRRGQICIFMTHLQSRLGDLDEALASGIRALEIGHRFDDARLRIPATTYLAQVHYFRGNYEQAVALATSNLAALCAESVSEDFGLVSPPSVVDRCCLFLSLAELGRFADAAEHEAEAIRLAMTTQNAFSVGWTHLAASWIRLIRGEWAQARPLFERATAVLSRGNVVALHSLSAGFSLWGLTQLGETREAAVQLRESEQLLERRATSGYVGDLGWGYLPLARAALLLGRLDDARRLTDRAFQFSPRQPGFAVYAMHLLGEVATHPSRFDAENGETHYRQALARAEPRGMRPLVAHCHFGLGKLYRRTSKCAQAQQRLTTAMKMYREMGMRFWFKQAEAEERQLQ